MKKIIGIILIFLAVFFIVDYKKNNSYFSGIKKRGVLLVGTTGDYRPMSFYNKDTNTYEGFDIALAQDLADSLNVKLKFIPTNWKSLMQDTIEEKFDVALSGITITETRKQSQLMSKGYLDNGKTVLCRSEDAKKYTSIDKINKKNVRVMENPGGLNEQFARENLPEAELIIHNVNEEIPLLIALGKADVMITEIIEAKYYVLKDKRLSAPIADTPFTKGQIGMLLPKKNKRLLNYVNKFIDEENKNGRLEELKAIYIDNNKGNYK